MVETIDNKAVQGKRGRKGGASQSPEWMVSRKAADHCDMKYEEWKRYSAAGLLPPCLRDTRCYKHSREYLNTWMVLRRLGLWTDWKTLKQKHGEDVAWEVMCRRLDKKRAEIEALAAEVAPQ